MKYSPAFFSRGLPKWKRKKDTFYCRIIIRPLSFLISSLCATFHISANSVSYFNILIALSSAVLFLINNYVCALIGAILASVWLLLDCVDGNIARCIKKQPYGEYADSVSSYFLAPLLSLSLSFYTFNNGGVVLESGQTWIILLGSIAALSDTMMRLIYHKYKEVTNHMIEMGVVEKLDDSRNDHSKVNSIKVKIEMEGGVAGFVPILLIFSVIFRFTDIFVFYCALYYIGAFIVTFLLYTLKTLKYRKKSFVDPEDMDKQQN